MSSDQFLFQHKLKKENSFCFLGGFRTKLQVCINDVWSKDDDLFVHLGKFKAVWSTSGKAWILFTIDGKKPIPSNAQNRLEKADGHQDQENILTDQKILTDLWQLTEDGALYRKSR